MHLLAGFALATVLTHLSVGAWSPAHQPCILRREGDEPAEPNNISLCPAGKDLAGTVSDIVLKFIGELFRVRPLRRELSRPSCLPHH